MFEVYVPTDLEKQNGTTPDSSPVERETPEGWFASRSLEFFIKATKVVGRRAQTLARYTQTDKKLDFSHSLPLAHSLLPLLCQGHSAAAPVVIGPVQTDSAA